MNRCFYVLFFAVIVFCSCTKEQKTNIIVSSETTVCCKDDASLSSLLSIKRIVPLETNRESLIGASLGKIQKSGRYIYVSFDFNTLLQFDETGKFIRKIGRVGSGPGEFLMVGDFALYNGYVYVRDYMRILQYTEEGIFVKEIPFAVNITGINIAGDKILGVVTREMNISYIFDLNGNRLADFYPASSFAEMGAFVYYWPYKEGKFLLNFYLSNNVLLVNPNDNSYTCANLTDLPDMLTVEKADRLWTEHGRNIDFRTFGSYIWPFNSNGRQLYFVTHTDLNDEGILWFGKPDVEKYRAYDNKRLKNDVTFVPICNFFNEYTYSDTSFLSCIQPSELKDALKSAKDTSTPYYTQMKALADSLGEEDNFVLIEYEFK